MALSPADIRALRHDNPKARARDLAQAHGLPEAALVAAHIGHGALPVVADPAVLGPRLAALGEVGFGEMHGGDPPDQSLMTGWVSHEWWGGGELSSHSSPRVPSHTPLLAFSPPLMQRHML